MSVRTLTLLAGCCLAVLVTMHAPQAAAQGNPVVVIETSQGNITAELDQAKAPLSVANFLEYVESGHYSGTVFHRVIKTFMIQGGGFTVGENDQLVPKTEGLRGQIVNQATRNLQNRRGTVAMARGGGPDTARQQFFINLDDNSSFDFKNPTPDGIGYAVFGRVTDGLNVVRDIGRVRTGELAPDVPNEAVVITSITMIAAGP